MNTMRISFTLCILFACSTIVLCGTHPDGVSKVSREQDALGNYKFSYAVSNPEGEHFREEGTDHLGRVIGTYGLTHVDGTQRVVQYVADKDGFRAEIQSNEPGVISSDSADSSVVKLQSNPSLVVAATSIENSGATYGSRIKTDTSRVSYANKEGDKLPQQDSLDISPKESRQRNYEDYRPRNPVAYYPSGTIDTARPLNPPPAYAPDVPARAQQPRSPSGETRPLDVYLPPIDPQTALRQPPYLRPRERTSDQSPYTTTSRRPFIPPYGGFDDEDDEPAPAARRPDVSMSTIHGGLGRDDFEPARASTPGYGAGRYPSDDATFSREYVDRHFPSRSNFPPLPRYPGGVLSPPSRSIPRPIFGPPSYDTGLRPPPNVVLRAVPIPNGIQAVRVDPETGRVYERLVYPVFVRDGQTVYDRNILLHNDDISDDSAVRNLDSGYLDIPFRHRYRYIRNPGFGPDEDFVNITRRFNRTLDPLSLSIPTARDLERVHRQLSQVEGFDRSHFPNPSFFRNTQYRNNDYPLFNDFDDSSNAENIDTEDGPYSRARNTERSRSSFSRDPRLLDRLTPEDTKEIVVSKSENLSDDAESDETDPKPSVVEKE